MSSKYALNPHALVRFLEKDAKDFTKDDIIRYVTENEIEMINFRYPGADGRLKTLNFIINSTPLSYGFPEPVQRDTCG